MTRTGIYVRSVATVGVVALMATACSNGDDSPTSSGGEVTLSMAHSYATNHPHHTCGAEVVREEVAAADVGLEIEVFPDSSLGGHAERFASVVSGDIDIDLQGASEISQTYEPIGVLDAAYVFDDADHLFEFFETDRADQLRQDMLKNTGARVLDVWYFGMRHFTSNTPLNSPEDFGGLRMRFPDTPQFLQNAEALGAAPTSVAFEEVYISLQQGVVDGQENPIPVIDSLNLQEVQSHLNLTGHMTGFVLPVVNEKVWQSLSDEQRDTLESAIATARESDRECMEEEENSLVDEWRETGVMEVVEPDVEAFRQRAESFFSDELDGEALDLYQAIRDAA